MSKKSIHQPVLLQEAIEALKIKPGMIIFDGTLGGGGYAEVICQKLKNNGLIIGTDLDQNALKRVKEKLKNFSQIQKKFFLRNYSELKEILAELKIEKVDGIVLDLGISSDQLEQEQRGISFQKREGELDMNLSLTAKNKIKAKDILNDWSEENIADILFYYGNERASKKLASAIVKKRKEKKFERVGELVDLIELEIGHFYRHKKIHPATKTFQALRITVNDEIENLKKVLNEGIDCLSEGGKIAVVSFHSLEDRVVKKIFREMERAGKGQRVNKKVIIPSDEEIEKNQRARSAKLRIFKKK